MHSSHDYTTTLMIGEKMKILIVGSARTGTTYLHRVLVNYFRKDILKDTICSDLNFTQWSNKIMDEPFCRLDNSVFEQKSSFEQIIKLNSWVIKLHVDHMTEYNYKWITQLYKQADIIVKIVRSDIFGTIYSLSIAETLGHFGENFDKEVILDRTTVLTATDDVYRNMIKLESVPHNIQIDYQDLGSPAEVVKLVLGVDNVNEFKLQSVPRKNTAKIANKDEVNSWINNWLAVRAELTNRNVDFKSLPNHKFFDN